MTKQLKGRRLARADAKGLEEVEALQSGAITAAIAKRVVKRVARKVARVERAISEKAVKLTKGTKSKRSKK